MLIITIEGIILLIIMAISIGMCYINSVYKNYKISLSDALTLSKGRQLSLYKNIRMLYRENPEIFTVCKRDVYTLQTGLQYDDYDCYLNEYYIIIDGYSLYLCKSEYIKYWFWIKFIIRKYKRQTKRKHSGRTI